MTAQRRLPEGFRPDTANEVEWAVSQQQVDYQSAVSAMEDRVAAIAQGQASELIWLLEHPPMYTAGTSAKEEDLLQANRFPVFTSGRGGEYTYHGPGQRVVYVMLDVKRRTGGDVRKFVALLEWWLISVLAEFGIKGETRDDRVGVWVPTPERGEMTEAKIAAIGIRVRKWVSFHGLSMNVSPDLEHFDGIVPCGVSEHGVTSLTDLGHPASLERVDDVLRRVFETSICRTKSGAPPA